LNTPGVTIIEGEDGLKRIYRAMLRQAPKNSTWMAIRDSFVWSEPWDFIFKSFWKDTRKDKSIKTKLLVNNSEFERDATVKNKEYLRGQKVETRFLSGEKIMENFALNIIGDSLNICSLEKNNLIGIHIVNKNMADNFASLFRELWGKS
jgi:hypothetical protein